MPNPDDEQPARRREQAEWRRKKLLDAALTAFGTKGLEATSMRDVAAVAGVTPGLVYHYFDGKEALALAVIAERGFLPELRHLLSESSDRPVADVLTRVVTDFARLLAGRAPLVALFFNGALSNEHIRKGLRAFTEEGQRLLAEYLAARAAGGEVRQHDSATLAQMLFAPVVLGQVVGSPVDPAAIARTALDALAPPVSAATKQKKLRS